MTSLIPQFVWLSCLNLVLQHDQVWVVNQFSCDRVNVRNEGDKNASPCKVAKDCQV